MAFLSVPNLTLLILSVAFGAIGWFWFKSETDKAVEEIEEDELQTKRVLMENGHRIKVDLKKTILKSNSYVVQVYVKDKRKTSYIQANSAKTADVYQSRIGVEIGDSEIIYWSPIIDNDETTIRMKMALQEFTWLYIDKEDPEVFYFDISFLE